MKLPSEMLQKLAIFLEYEDPCSLFHLSFRATLFFLLIIYVNTDQGIQ